MLKLLIPVIVVGSIESAIAEDVVGKVRLHNCHQNTACSIICKRNTKGDDLSIRPFSSVNLSALNERILSVMVGTQDPKTDRLLILNLDSYEYCEFIGVKAN